MQLPGFRVASRLKPYLNKENYRELCIYIKGSHDDNKPSLPSALMT